MSEEITKAQHPPAHRRQAIPNDRQRRITAAHVAGKPTNEAAIVPHNLIRRCFLERGIQPVIPDRHLLCPRPPASTRVHPRPSASIRVHPRLPSPSVSTPKKIPSKYRLPAETGDTKHPALGFRPWHKYCLDNSLRCVKYLPDGSQQPRFVSRRETHRPPFLSL